MSYSKDPSRYPDEFQGLFQSARTKKLELNCDNTRDAQSLAHKLNCYRRAMEITKTPGYKECQMIIVRRKGQYLILENKSNSISEIINRSKITLTSNEPNETELDERMRQIEEKEDEKEDE